MFEICRGFIDKYRREFAAVEKITKTGANGEEYILYNLYPLHTKPTRTTTPSENMGFYYKPYLYVTEETLNLIFARYI